MQEKKIAAAGARADGCKAGRLSCSACNASPRARPPRDAVTRGPGALGKPLHLPVEAARHRAASSPGNGQDSRLTASFLLPTSASALALPCRPRAPKHVLVFPLAHLNLPDSPKLTAMPPHACPRHARPCRTLPP